jgi:hypothetical protein
MAAFPLKLGIAGLYGLSSSLVSDIVLQWMPDAATFGADLRRVRRGFDEADGANQLTSFQGMSLGGSEKTWWSGNDWSRFTSEHWGVALVFVAAYLISIPSLKWLVARYGKQDVKKLCLLLECWPVSFFLVRSLCLRACASQNTLYERLLFHHLCSSKVVQ